MANLVLYRKHRPQNFAEIIGQEHIVQTLAGAFSLGMISHAYLFAGPRGSGKTTIARLLAKAANCEKLQGYDPCNKCSSCLEIMEGRSLDLIEIDAASHRGIDEIRELKESVRFAPTKSKYKVFILDEAHQLSKDAANALLKTLEEPPLHVIFILATTEIHKMIPTIVSRCQRFDFRKLTLPEIVKRLEIICRKEKVKVEKSALELIAAKAGGSIRDAESLLGQTFVFADSSAEPVKAGDIQDLLGLVEIETIAKFVDFLGQRNAGQAINFLNEIIEEGLDIKEFAKSLIDYLRQGLLLRITGIEEAKKIITGLTTEQIQKLEKQTGFFAEKELIFILNAFIEAENKIKYSSIPQLPLELAIVEILEKK